MIDLTTRAITANFKTMIEVEVGKKYYCEYDLLGQSLLVVGVIFKLKEHTLVFNLRPDRSMPSSLFTVRKIHVKFLEEIID